MSHSPAPRSLSPQPVAAGSIWKALQKDALAATTLRSLSSSSRGVGDDATSAWARPGAAVSSGGEWGAIAAPFRSPEARVAKAMPGMHLDIAVPCGTDASHIRVAYQGPPGAFICRLSDIWISDCYCLLYRLVPSASEGAD